jgi:hypothetical protein
MKIVAMNEKNFLHITEKMLQMAHVPSTMQRRSLMIRGPNVRKTFIFVIHASFIGMALLKLNVDFDPMVIGAEGARLLREKRVKGDPTG